MKLLLAILILAIVLIAGCTQINSIACKPNYVVEQTNDLSIQPKISDDYCKSLCYNFIKVTSYKIENNANQSECSCDVNNCNP